MFRDWPNTLGRTAPVTRLSLNPYKAMPLGIGVFSEQSSKDYHI
jgi:hypothetical protein